MKKSVTAVFGLIFMILPLCAEGKTTLQNVKFVLADKAKGKELLTTEDDFVQAQSDFDRSARLKVSREVSKEEYLNFVGKQTMDWTKDEKKTFEATFKTIKQLGKKYNLEYPETVYFVKTTGLEEGMSAYCRGQNVVVIPQGMASQKDSLLDLCIHELFHIYSKNNLDVREKLYSLVGYYKTGALQLPSELEKIKITNPDSVVSNYYFKGTVGGKSVNVMPLLLAGAPYDEKQGGEFFEYMLFVFGEVNTGDVCTLAMEDGSPKLIQFDQISDYMEKVGQNTGYVIHAEEILADNFVILLKGTKNVPTPELTAAIKEVFELK